MQNGVHCNQCHHQCVWDAAYGSIILSDTKKTHITLETIHWTSAYSSVDRVLLYFFFFFLLSLLLLENTTVVLVSMSSSQSNNPPLPTLSAPNRTFVSKQPPRRTSTFSTTSPVSPIASSLSPTSPLTRTPSNEVVEPFYPPGASSQLPIATAAANTIKQTIASTTSSFLRKPSESHLFSAAQSSALKTLSSAVSLSINDSSFWPALLQTTKFPSSHSL